MVFLYLFLMGFMAYRAYVFFQAGRHTAMTFSVLASLLFFGAVYVDYQRSQSTAIVSVKAKDRPAKTTRAAPRSLEKSASDADREYENSDKEYEAEDY